MSFLCVKFFVLDFGRFRKFCIEKERLACRVTGRALRSILSALDSSLGPHAAGARVADAVAVGPGPVVSGACASVRLHPGRMKEREVTIFGALAAADLLELGQLADRDADRDRVVLLLVLLALGLLVLVVLGLRDVRGCRGLGDLLGVAAATARGLGVGDGHVAAVTARRRVHQLRDHVLRGGRDVLPRTARGPVGERELRLRDREHVRGADVLEAAVVLVCRVEGVGGAVESLLVLEAAVHLHEQVGEVAALDRLERDFLDALGSAELRDVDDAVAVLEHHVLTHVALLQAGAGGADLAPVREERREIRLRRRLLSDGSDGGRGLGALRRGRRRDGGCGSRGFGLGLGSAEPLVAACHEGEHGGGHQGLLALEHMFVPLSFFGSGNLTHLL